MTIAVQFENSWCRVMQASPDELNWIEEYLSCEDTRYQPQQRHRPAFMGAEDDRVFCMFDRVGRIFPSGLLHNMRGVAKAVGVDIEVDDVREVPCAIESDEAAGLDWLRDYQLDAVHKTCRRTRGLIDAPTGSGKSEIFIALTKKLPCEWLFVVHRKGLVLQIMDRYRLRTGEEAGTFKDGRWVRGTSNVTVATFQAIHRAMTNQKMVAASKALLKPGQRVEYLLKNIEALFVDEVHSQAADTWNAVSMAMVRAYYRFGASATCLDKTDRENMRVMAVTGPFAYRISHQLLVERGILARSVVRMVECEQDCDPMTPWPDVYRGLVTYSRARNELLADIVGQAAKPCLCFVTQLSHGRELKRAIEANGLSVEFVHGKDSDDVRQAKARELDRANVDVILCTVVWQEGMDIPSIRSVVIATGGKSTVAAIQRRGRGTRIAAGAGGDVFELWDVMDIGQPWLQEHALLRRAAYESRGDKVALGWQAAS